MELGSGLASGLMAELWAGGLVATPVAICVALMCRCRSLRPATRHVLWMAVLASFVTPLVGMWAWSPAWSRSERVIAMAETAIEHLERNVFAPQGVEIEPVPAGSVDTRRAHEAHGGDVNGPAWPRSVLAGPAELPRAAAPAVSPKSAAAEDAGRAALVMPLEARMSRPGVLSAVRVGGPRDGTPAIESSSSVGEMVPLRADNSQMQPRNEGVTGDSAFGAPGLIVPEGPIVAAPESIATPRPPATGPVKRAASAWSAGVRDLVTRVLQVRDSLASLPPVPMTVWVCGAGLVIAVRVARTIAALGVLRGSRPASEHVQALVRDVATDLGLSRVPEAVMVDSTVSPMIWCGLRPKLVLPAGLWGALDRESRRAVVVHELAHLRRNDHVLCWIESLIGAAYWWHPVAWWARQRLRDEAETCCDAWVTSLLPSSRRAYAVALVAAKSYLSDGRGNRAGAPGAGPWLGVMSGSARRLARRITMVMTQKTAPRMSLVGGCVAALVVGAGMFLTPVLACPPEEGKPSAGAAKVIVVPRHAGTVTATAPSPVGEPAQPSVQFFGEAPALEAMRERRAPAAPRVMTLPRGAMPAQPAQPPAPPAPAKLRGLSGTLNPIAPRAAVGVDLEALKVGRTAKAYFLSEGKREAMWELMSRNDVPVLVESQGDHILVYARDEEHPVIAAFIKMIDPDGKGRSATVAGGSLRALSLADAKKASDESRRAYQELMLARKAVEGNSEKASREAERAREQYAELQELTRQLRQSAKGVGEAQAKATLEGAVEQLRSRSEALRGQSKEMDERARQLQRQVRELERRAQQLEQRLAGQGGASAGGWRDAEDETELALPVEVDINPEVEVDLDEVPGVIDVEGIPSPMEAIDSDDQVIVVEPDAPEEPEDDSDC